MIIYGINPVTEALVSGEVIEEIVVSRAATGPVAALLRAARKRNIKVKRVSAAEMERLTGVKKHQGVAAVTPGAFRYSGTDEIIRAWRGSGERALILILDSIQDPQNLGALIRTASSAGAHGIIIPRDRACPVTPVVVKASAGAAAHVKIAREVNLTRTIERLKAEGLWIAAIEAGCKTDIYSVDLGSDMAVVIGGESIGIRRLVKRCCDICASIPMKGRVNSLNAAQAGAVVMFEALRQRSFSRS